MADEIVRLKVGVTGASEAQVARLERLDAVVESLKKKSDINISIQGLPKNMGNAEESAKAAAKYINAQANMIKAQNQLAVEQERTRQAIAGQAAQEIKAQAAADGLVQTQQQYNRLWTVLEHQIMNAVIQNVRKATTELKAMNAEMVSIQKVTGATDAEMQRLKDSAFEVAGDLGSTPSDYLASVTKWAQAGYKGLSDQLGELSAKTQVVGDVNEETANKFLLAVDAAYKYKGNVGQLTQVLDGANEISNNYATSVDKLANGMGIVSSLAEQAGMKVEQTMAAIGTITAKTQESGNSAARALRALILNIQGSTEIEIDTETGERWAEDEIQRTAAALGKLSVATREYKDGVMALRNPMEVIGELAEKYQKGLVTEAQLQEVVASLGGKVRSNQLMALIQGFDTYQKMIETYKDAVGSADQELEIYLNGWEAKSNKLVAQWTQFVESFKASDISMGLLDIGNHLLWIANTDLGNIAAQVIAITTAITAFKAAAAGEEIFPAIVSIFAKIPQGLKGIAKGAKEAAGDFTGLTAVMKGAKGGAIEFTKALYSALGPVGLVVVGITVLSAAYDTFARGAAKAASALAEAESEYEQSAAKLQSLQDELKTTQDRIDELNGKDSLTVVEQEELDRLKEQNTELEREIILEEKLNQIRKEERDAAAREALDKGYSGTDMSFLKAATIDFWGDTKDFILRDLRFDDFAQGAEYLSERLDQLNKKKAEFLAKKPNAGTWTENEQQMMEQIEKELGAYQSVAVEFRKELNNNIAALTDPETAKYWKGVSESLWESIAPAEALTEKFNRLVDAMDEAEHSRFADALERIQADGKVTAQEVQSLIDRFPVLKQLLDANGGSLDTLAQYFTESAEASKEAAGGINEAGGAAEDSEKAMEELTKDLKSAVSGMEAVKDAQKELKENGQLSTNTLIALLGNYGDSIDDVILKALAGLATQEEISRALEEAYQADLDKYRKTILEKNMENEDFYASWLSENAGTVKKLAEEYGIDARQYQTFARLKAAIETGAQTAQTNAAIQGKNDRIKIFSDIQTAFENTQDAMVLKAQESTGAISRMYSLLSGLMGGIAKGLAGPMSALTGPAIDKINEVNQLKLMYAGLGDDITSIYSSMADGLLELHKDLIWQFDLKANNQRTMEEIAADDAAMVEEYRKMQDQVHQLAEYYRSQGVRENSKLIRDLQDKWWEYEKAIRSMYENLTDAFQDYIDESSHKIEELGRATGNVGKQIEIYAQRIQKAQETISALQAHNINGERNGDIHDLESQIWSDKDAIRDLQEGLWDELERAFDDIFDKAKDDIDAIGEEIEGIQDQMDEINDVLAQYDKELESILKPINATLEKLNKQLDAEKELQDYKEELAHKLILKRLEEQIKTLEEQKKSLEEQKKLVDRQKELLNKQIDAINKQISAINKQIEAYERESSARQKLIQDLIDRSEQEKKAWEDHYAALKDQYSQQLELLEAEKKSAEERKKAAEKQYDDWMDTWEDIRKSIETPARDISDILNDIARYGTPAMAGQVDRVTELLRQLGYAIDDVVSGGGYDPDGGGDWGGSSAGGNEGGSSGGDVDPFRRQVIDQMLANARQWASTSDETVRDNLARQNQELGAQIGANYSPASGMWDIFDYDANGNPSVKPGAYSASWGGYGVQAASAYSAPDTDVFTLFPLYMGT